MISKKRLAEELPALLGPNEKVTYLTTAQPKGAGPRNAAKTAAASVALGVATIALSGGAFAAGMNFSTEPIWIVVTTERVLLVKREGFEPLTNRFIGQIARRAVDASRRGHVLHELRITDREQGYTLRFNLGSRPRTARELVEAVQGTVPGLTRA